MYWAQLNYVYKAESNTEQQILSQSHTCVSINAHTLGILTVSTALHTWYILVRLTSAKRLHN